MRDGDGFKLVTRRRKRGCSVKESNQDRGNSSRLDCEDFDIDCEAVTRKLFEAVSNFGDSAYRVIVFNSLAESLGLLNLKGIDEIICYGLGRFSQYKSSKYQLVLLLSLKSQYNCRVHVYDPAFLPKEIEILQKLGLDIIEKNEEGVRAISDKVTLVYMPHCPAQLTNNLLYANWSKNLGNCILFANSISGVVDNLLRRDVLENRLDYMSRIRPYITEIVLKNHFEHEEVFNDLSIHVFTEKQLDRVPINFWTLAERPRYQQGEIEFITAEKT